MQTTTFGIGVLLRKISAGHFLIPQFQRDFTWKESQTKLLIDSIARNYPIGSLLILGKNEKVKLKSRRLDAAYPPETEAVKDSLGEEDQGSEDFYILDGQQRMTSIARVFLDAHPTKNYYFDLKKMYEHFSSENPNWIVSRVRGKKNPDRKDNNRLIRTDIALNQQRCDVYVSEYIEDSGDFSSLNKQALRNAAAQIKGIFEQIRNYSIPCVSLDSDASLDSVCRVFETINSTGTRLTTFDLAVARYYPEPDLKELLDSSFESNPILEEYETDGERILQILSLYKLRKDGKFPEATRSVLLSLHPDFISQHWENAAQRLANVYAWIKSLGATSKTQPPHGSLVSIAATSMCYPEQYNDPKIKNHLRTWYFCTTLAANPSPANNYKIGDDFRRLCDHLEKNDDMRFPRVFFNIDNILDIKHPNDSRYKAMQALMRSTAKTDLLTGEELNNELEDHHIFPKALTKSNVTKPLLESIANKIIVSKKTNRLIGSKNPDSYLVSIIDENIKSGTFNDLKRRFDSLLIPYDKDNPGDKDYYSIKNFDEFLRRRAELLIERIQEVVGDAWHPPSQDEDVNLEDDEFVEG